MSRRSKWVRPQAISYLEVDATTHARAVRGPISFDVFEQRYRSLEWPSVDFRTAVWNGSDFKQWTPVFAVDPLLRRLEPHRYRQ